MKYNGPCADTAGSAGEGLRKKGGTSMRKRNKVVSLLLAGCMAAGLLAGCGSSGGTQVATADNATAASTSTGAADSAAPETAGEVDGQINLRAVAFGNNFDVQDMGWRWMMGECYEGLMRDVADENGDRFEYAGAESMDVSDDGLVYTFHLRKDAKWSDGQPVTAADYEYGWKRLLNPEYGYSYSFYLFNVVGAEEYYNGQGSADEIGIKAVDDYADLLRTSVATPGNDHRLGANEAPPAIISIFVGEELEAVIDAIASDSPYAGPVKMKMDLGVDVLPKFSKDTTDRNRTSPFAFTGNKFEFRMPGSAENLSDANTILNTAVAKELKGYADELEGAEDFTSAAIALIKRTIRDHRRVIFNGNGYTAEWEEEAAKRGLPAGLTLSPETGDFSGGLKLRDGSVEVNCTVDTLLSLSRNRLDAEIAAILFD